MRTSICTFLPLVFGLVACSNYDMFSDGTLMHDNGSGNTTMGQASTIDWKLIQSSVLNSCTDCHAGTQDPELSTYADVQTNIKEVYDKVSTGIMPPSTEGYAPLTACQTAVLEEWMNAGTPTSSTVTVSTIPACANVGVGGGPTVPIKNQPLSYQVLLTQILQPKCLKCHNINNPSDASLYIFYPYSAMQSDTKNWNKPGAMSVVVQALSRTDSKRMPPPPNTALSADEIDYITRWIDAGKPQ